ncbi:MAG TPA: Mov34/MPN/PAD-1 family protein [Lacipirellulaceae bacterium]|nr:Mov34/MPN/PAD-1 family protein [Lacipirellulaceae bacterium]
MKSFRVEKCWTLVGRRQGPFWYARRTRPTSGSPSSVDFDADWVLEREETGGDVVGFFHTHPPGVPGPSARDNRTMRAWVSSFGKPLLCLIESDHTLRAYLYKDDEADAKAVTACELLPRGIVIAYDEGVCDDGR